MKKHEIVLGNEYPSGANNKRRKPKITAQQRRTITVSILLVIALVGACIYFGREALDKFKNEKDFGGYMSSEDRAEVNAVLSPQASKDKVTILLLGLDKDKTNTDTMMVVDIDAGTNKATIMSIPRDTKVRTKKYGIIRINSIYILDGAAGVIEIVKEITGLDINHHMVVDFSLFHDVVDILGGVDFYVPTRLWYKDPAQGLTIDLQKGWQRLDGDKAEQLVRSRNNYDEADITRTEVQRDFIKAMIGQHANMGNLNKLLKLYDSVEAKVISSLKYRDLEEYGKYLMKIPDENIHLFIMPGHVNDYDREGVSWYLYDAKEMQQLAREEFGHKKATVVPTPVPASGGGFGNLNTQATPKPQATPDPDDDDDDRPMSSSSPAPSNPPQSSSAPEVTGPPSATSTATPIASPTYTPTPIVPTAAPEISTAPPPTVTAAPTETEQPSYPQGL